MRKLLHITPFAVRAGCEMDCFHLIQALPDWGHEVMVLHRAAEMSAEWATLGARVSHLDCLEASLWSFTSTVRRAIQERHFSGVLLWSITRFPYVLHALRSFDLPVAVHVGNPIQGSVRRRAGYALAERLLSPLPRVRLVACSEHVRRSLKVEPMLAAIPTDVIRNPITLPIQAHVPRHLDTATEIRMGMVARLDPIKDHATVLRAWPKIVSQLPKAKLELVGDGVLKEQLEAQAISLGVAASVRFLGHRSDVTAISREWDVFIYSTTEREGLGNALAEALALGLPVVVCDLAVMREVCGGAEHATFFQAGSAEALASAVVKVVPDLKRRQTQGAKARGFAAVTYDPFQCSRDHLAVLGLQPRGARLAPDASTPKPVLLHLSPLAMQAGCEMNCLRIVQALPEFKHRVLVLGEAGVMSDRWKAAGAEVDHLAALELARTQFFSKLVKYFHGLPQPAVGAIYWSTTRLQLVLHAARYAQTPMVAHVGNPTDYSWRHAVQRLEEIALPSISGVRLAACSQYVYGSLAMNPYLRRFPSEVIYNPVEIPEPRHEPRPLRPDMLVKLGMVARIDRIKDHGTVLRGLKLLKEKYPNVVLEFAGDGDLRRLIERSTSDLGLDNHVRFLGHVKDVSARTVNWDLFIYSTTSAEGLGNSVIEAQAVGLPCIISDLPMMREVGGDESGCDYFPAGDAPALATAAIALLDDWPRRLELSRRGRAWAASVFSPRRAARRYLAALGISIDDGEDVAD